MNVRDLVPWSRGDRERSPATRSESLHPVLSLHREMNRLFDDVFRGFDDSRLSPRNGPYWGSAGANRYADDGGGDSCDIDEILGQSCRHRRSRFRAQSRRVGLIA